MLSGPAFVLGIHDWRLAETTEDRGRGWLFLQGIYEFCAEIDREPDESETVSQASCRAEVNPLDFARRRAPCVLPGGRGRSCAPVAGG